MKKWRACATYYGPEQSKYEIFEFEISDELYDKLSKCVEDRVPINSLDCFDELESIANEELDKLDVLEYWEEEPDKDDYDDEEEYQEALEEYQSEKEAFFEEWSLECLEIEDPGDRLRILDNYIGKKVADEQEADEVTLSEEIEQGEFDENTCYLEYTVDINGCLIDFSATAEGLESESIKHTRTAECFPDYDRIDEFFSELVEEYE